MSKQNRILMRQLAKLGLSTDSLPQTVDQWQNFLKLIDLAYTHHEEDRILLERSIDLSNEEIDEKIHKNKQMSLKLAQASKLSSLGTLSSGIAHELNNPLMGVMGHIQILKTKKEDYDDQQHRLGRCIKLLDRMAKIISHLRNLSRISKEEDYKIIDIFEPIQNTFDLLQKQLEYDKIKFTFQKNKIDSLKIKGDSNRIESVIQNLVINSLHAFQAMAHRKNKKIEITVTANPSFCQIDVFDNAGGIPEHIQKNIFDPFFTTKEVGKGTGLGTSIAKQIIEEHKGNITFTTKEGEWTKFSIRIPITDEKEKTVHVMSNLNIDVEKIPSIAIQEKKLMLVDDEPDICQIYGTILQETFTVDTFTDPLKAKKALAQNNYDLLITDIKMPKVNGFELAQISRKINPLIHIIFMSGHMDLNLQKETSGIENFHFVPKPFSHVTVLDQLVKEILHKSEKAKKAA